MQKDKYDRCFITENELADLYLSDPDIKFTGTVLCDKAIIFPDILDLTDIPKIKKYQEIDIDVAQYDNIAGNTWFMPDEYKELDIATYVLDKCETEEELQRAGHELIQYQERGLFMMLRYIKYLVDIMKKNNIVWGVGRGSSVSSYVLYLIGIHKINSIYYDLDFEEFIRPLDLSNK